MKYLCLVHLEGDAIGELNEAESEDLDRRSIDLIETEDRLGEDGGSR
jgi:hypothetical protein